ncbi:Metalloendopeptidase [Meloidogyne graminicola]|uniref:Metalloendopeptidase n=2 Tax=Meloidogyne graminicola TaxID=189291 RepID=A0A8S9ZQD0_9BILA|nr:Metalloendopeptidase [Meloidogyne graminicola]
MQVPEGPELQEIPDGGDGELQTAFCEIETLTVKEKEKLKNKIKNKIYRQNALRSKNLSFRIKRSTVNAKMKIWNNLKFFDQKTKKVKFIIPYKVLSKYDKKVFKTVLNAMDLISKRTCVTFTNIDNNNKYKGKDYLAIVNEPGCHSVIGRNLGKNVLHLELGPKMFSLKTGLWVRKTCVKHRIVLHELFHLLGVFHEHQRSDRDKYIEIFEKNIREDKKINFIKIKNDETWGLPYNYDSIMNYRENIFNLIL